jgi:hypothetical protein
MLDAVRRWAARIGAAVMNFGGGTGGQVSSLFDFKSGFSRSRAPFHTARLIFDTALYDAVTPTGAGRDAAPLSDAGFFPIYREPRRPPEPDPVSVSTSA